MNSMPVERLIAEGRVWRGRQGLPAGRALASGWPPLDALLPGGGWPQGGVVEILPAAPGIGELGLLMPALAAIAAWGRPLLWIGPPRLPYPPALAACGIAPGRSLLVRAEGREALWAAEQALRCEDCGAVLLWPGCVGPREARRLQLAAEEGGTPCFTHLPPDHPPTPAALRLLLRPAGNGLEVRIARCRGRWPAGPVVLERRGALA
ncbi:translesion DNA synthesis-associated protein ImuA [Inmirania thermothiophila]|nr:translesion DNA synthesis-associated protein ImuA [Inmirania thermothiophila]